MITDEKLAYLRKVCERATPPPWHYYPCGEKSNDCVLGVAVGEDGCPPSGEIELHPYNEETGTFEMNKYILDPEIASQESCANYFDFAFIAEAREALPMLLDEVERLQRALTAEGSRSKEH